MTKQWTYQTTHPWITFQLDPASFTPELWVLLGECQSKCEHVAGVPLKPETAEELSRVYLTKGIKGTTGIEGNQLSEDEVRDELTQPRKELDKLEYSAREVANMGHAYETVRKDLLRGMRRGISLQSILADHSIILSGIGPSRGISPGNFRKDQVAVGIYRAPSHDECEHLMQLLCDWINVLTVLPGQATINGIVRAVVAHLYIGWIHPFLDGNGRTARLVELQILLQTGIPEVSAHLLSNHYYSSRQEYYDQFEAASIIHADVKDKFPGGLHIVPFLEYSVRGLLNGLESQLTQITFEHWNVMWQHFVHEHFRNMKTEKDIRRRNLLLDISDAPPLEKWRDMRYVSARVAEAYANKTDKTLERDVDYLRSVDLISAGVLGGYRAKKERILAFLPLRIETD